MRLMSICFSRICVVDCYCVAVVLSLRVVVCLDSFCASVVVVVMFFFYVRRIALFF